MHAQIFFDPRIRDYVFVPLVILMIGMQMIRITGMRYMNEPKNILLEPAKIAYSTLFGTKYERDADRERRVSQDQIDMSKILEEGTEQNTKEGQALKRSQRIRKTSEILPEDAVKTRKAYYCDEKKGYLSKDLQAANPMNMMANPDMMNQMLKSNIQSVINMFMFTAIGNIFQGFITAQVPFPLGHKFKQMLQQGLMVTALDATYVSSMSWAFILIFGLN